MAGTSYEVWELPEWRVATARSRKWHAAAHLGPQARGRATNYLHKVEETPPIMRRSSLRESLRFSHAPLKVLPMNTDDPVGSSRTEYQSSYTALELRDGRRDILFRIVGTSPRGPEALRDTTTQRGKVGFCVRRARVAHIAVPITFAVGADDWLKGQGVNL